MCKVGFRDHSTIVKLPRISSECIVALQVGGDNYTLDYGRPVSFLEIDRRLMRMGVPLALWGASVGPFTEQPGYESRIVKHLKKFMVIYARESRTTRYLRALGLQNVVEVSDPAFLMEAEPVAGLDLPNRFIGINLSPLTAKRATGGDLDAWVEVCRHFVHAVVDSFGLSVVLIPHVSTGRPGTDDAIFLERIFAECSGRPVTLLPSTLNAAQTKWVVSQSWVFCGARTHSTIAALSSTVPTLSLAYSTKAWGLNEDIFGHKEYCLDVVDLADDPSRIVSCLAGIVYDREKISMFLRGVLPEIERRALLAGQDLRCRLGHDSDRSSVVRHK